MNRPHANPRWLRWLDRAAIALAPILIAASVVAISGHDTGTGMFLIVLAVADLCSVVWARRRRTTREGDPVSPALQAVVFFVGACVFGVVMAILVFAGVIAGGAILAVAFLVGAVLAARMSVRGLRMLRDGSADD
jgi:FtsH-binding integral membrane protein